MKKILLFISILMMPLNVLAYSEYVIPSGQNIGIEIKNKGIYVIGFYKINNKFNKGFLKEGDLITKVNNIEVSTVDELVETIEKEVIENKVYLTIIRNEEEITKIFELVNDNGKYKTGLYVKDKVVGIGTISYIDPETNVYGALGHEVTLSNTNKLIEVKTGEIFRSSVTTIDKSVRGSAGAKNAKFYSNEKYGTVEVNTIKGIYGMYSSGINSEDAIKVADFNEIEKGLAYIKTVLSGEEVSTYQIEIDRITEGKTKNIHFKITDDELLKKTGGVVQGMSGSPIIQNGKIIGAVTHVIVDNPEEGYGIFIRNMLEEGDKILNQ